LRKSGLKLLTRKQRIALSTNAQVIPVEAKRGNEDLDDSPNFKLDLEPLIVSKDDLRKPERKSERRPVLSRKGATSSKSVIN